MSEKSLRERCRVNTSIESDTFVGIQCVDGDYRIYFPLGFHLEQEEKLVRKDIFLLLRVLDKFNDKKESVNYGRKKQNESSFPVREYLFVIKDYFERGYYKEVEKQLKVAKRGKIDWGRTIKTQRAVIQNDEAYYLDYVTRKSNINENELITLIHKYCVYVSFLKLGWMFTSFMPMKPKIPQNVKTLISVVFDKLQNTFNDRNRELFSAMLAILKNDGTDADRSFEYGTSHFEYVWEKMLDYSFGIDDKADYFPKTTWNFPDGNKYDNANLMPDTIMLANGKVYVLDAKYYKYGWTGIPAHLPESTSINKQITYGEYVAESKKFVDSKGNAPVVYNAFIMPYDCLGKTFSTGKDMHFIGTASSDWKDGSKEYEHVLGFLMDVKYLMNLQPIENDNEIQKLAKLIEEKYQITRNI